MPLLFEDDYNTLRDARLNCEEEESSRFLVFKDFPLPESVYVSDNKSLQAVNVLYIIPPNYNTEGGDMFWVYPRLQRADGVAIPATSGPNEDSRTYNGIEYFRWSRHWNKNPWKPKIDNIQTIIDRITWAFNYPDAKRP